MTKKITDLEVREKAIARIKAGGDFILFAVDGNKLIEGGSIADTPKRPDVMRIIGEAMGETSARLMIGSLQVEKQKKRPAKKRTLETKPRAKKVSKQKASEVFGSPATARGTK